MLHYVETICGRFVTWHVSEISEGLYLTDSAEKIARGFFQNDGVEG